MKTILLIVELFVLVYTVEAHKRLRFGLAENSASFSRSLSRRKAGSPPTDAERTMSLFNPIIMPRSLPFLNSNSSVLTNITNSSSAMINSTFGLNGTQSKVSSASGITAVFGSSFGATSSNGQMNDQTGIKDGTIQNLVRYAKFSAASYAPTCSYPDGVTMVKQFGISTAVQQRNLPSAAMGFVARDDSNMELIVAFQGDPTLQVLGDLSSSAQASSLIDPSQLTTSSPGFPVGSLINLNLLENYLSCAAELDSVVQNQLQTYAGYGITFTGQGTAGAIANLAAVSSAMTYSSVPMQLVSFGSPRVGNSVWAKYTDSLFLTDNTARNLRVTQSLDPTPQVLGETYGYQHSGVELYQTDSNPSMPGMFQCTGAEDPRCSASLIVTKPSTSLANSPGSDMSYGLSGQSATDQGNSNEQSISGQQDTGTGTSNAPVILGPASLDPSSSLIGPVSCDSCIGTSCVGCLDNTGSTMNIYNGNQAAVRSSTNSPSGFTSLGVSNGQIPISSTAPITDGNGRLMSGTSSTTGNGQLPSVSKDGSISAQAAGRFTIIPIYALHTNTNTSNSKMANSEADTSNVAKSIVSKALNSNGTLKTVSKSGISGAQSLKNNTTGISKATYQPFNSTKAIASPNVNRKVLYEGASPFGGTYNYMYLGISMTVDGSQFCQAGAASIGVGSAGVGVGGGGIGLGVSTGQGISIGATGARDFVSASPAIRILSSTLVLAIAFAYIVIV